MSLYGYRLLEKRRGLLTSQDDRTNSRMMDAASSDRSILPEKPHQPRAFHFPKREYGKKSVVRRSFQTAWFDKWPWLHYREENESVLCYTCLKAKVGKKLSWAANA